MKMEEMKSSLGGPVGSDALVPPDVFALSSSFSVPPPRGWREALSEAILNEAPKNMREPDAMDEGALREMEEVERGERSKDQYSKYSGFEKPEGYGEGTDDDFG
ncbi:hypothetical protein TrRE_jg8830 [Triparma retinervis]|uniref:Uncharacterized protein n=1 Tax=Triparma retinervis TaxID=2557542 RepID=A0A9W6ZBD1_9STRA|nr:hypothetical protein TrRE_jg8830 [Triparma retinervis]